VREKDWRRELSKSKKNIFKKKVVGKKFWPRSFQKQKKIFVNGFIKNIFWRAAPL
jgi:hypothetical protein